MSSKTHTSAFLNYWKTTLGIVIICYLSFAPSSAFKSIPSFTHGDKIIHLLMYLMLTIIIINDFYKRNKSYSNTGFFLICILFPIVLGGVIEIVQDIFIFSRSGSWYDWLADVMGALCGWTISVIRIKKRTSKFL